jgi:hypothetical protein
MIEEVVEVTDEHIAALGLLLPQLSSIAPLPSQLEIEDIITSTRTALFIARDPDQNDDIVGIATLAMYRTPTGLHPVCCQRRSVRGEPDLTPGPPGCQPAVPAHGLRPA